jgi:hypothetical protein
MLCPAYWVGNLRLVLDVQVLDADRLWEYTVLVTDVAYPLESIGQLYRDRWSTTGGVGTAALHIRTPGWKR